MRCNAIALGRLVAAAAFLVASPALAVDVCVTNPSFEDTSTYSFSTGEHDGEDAKGPPPGWSTSGNWNDQTSGDPGRGGIIESNYAHAPADASDGSYVGFMVLSANNPPDLATNTLWQTPLASLAPDTLYTLEFDVANRTTNAASDSDENPDITVRAFFTLGNSGQNDFANAVGTAFSTTADALTGGVWNAGSATFDTTGLGSLDQRLNIVLDATTTNNGVSVIRWDDVRLTAVASGGDPLLTNGSFEWLGGFVFSDATQNGEDDNGTPCGWNTSGNWDDQTSVDPGRGGSLESSYTHLPADASDGDYVGFVVVSDNNAPDLATNTLWQTPLASLALATTYTLEFDVANRTTDDDYDNLENPDITVRAFFTLGSSGQTDFGNAVGTTFSTTADALTGGAWNAGSATLDTSSVGDLNQPLNVVLSVETTSSQVPGVSVIRFDDVRLTGSAPIAAVGRLPLGLLALLLVVVPPLAGALRRARTAHRPPGR